MSDDVVINSELGDLLAEVARVRAVEGIADDGGDDDAGPWQASFIPVPPPPPPPYPSGHILRAAEKAAAADGNGDNNTGDGNRASPLRPNIVFIVLQDSSIVGVHRSIKAACVDAWIRALTSRIASVPTELVVDGWQVCSGSGTARTETWTLDVDDACRVKGTDQASRWLSELRQTRRVPRVLWTMYMSQVAYAR